MLVSYKWLKDFINLELSPAETAEKLTLIGLEVDSTTDYGNDLDGVIVGEVLDVREHPNADKLYVCTVNLGNERVQIVCGADNVEKGYKVPVATIGTTLPVTLDSGEKLTIKETEIRGEVSKGMICAEDELGLGRDHSGIMILDNGSKTGEPLRDVIDLYTDTVFDIEITPNRPDTTCHLGVARDLSAALDLELKKPFDNGVDVDGTLDENVTITIENPDKCHRYVGMIIENATISESPAWLQNRLKAIGVRPVNNVVDATNFVMYELGQPLHAFDLNTIRGNQIIVKDYDKEVTFETLDHVKRKCSPGTLFICDAEGPVAIGGVMGGVDSEVDDSTTDILLESAYFDPVTIRKTAKEQNLQTDASYRFERGVDPNVQRIAAERCAGLIAELTGGDLVDGVADIHPVKTVPWELTLRIAYVNRLLGTDLTVDDTIQLLEGLELEVIKKDNSSITYRVPTFRPDLTREVDLIEEAGRLYDYNKIPMPTHTSFMHPEAISEHEKLINRVKDYAKSLQFKEIYTNSLMPEKDAGLLGDLDLMIHTLNPISMDMTTLRPTLLYGFLQSASFNFNRNRQCLRFFEIGNTFLKCNGEGTFYEGIREETKLLLGIAGFKTVEHWSTDAELYDLFDLKAPVNSILEQLGLSGLIKTRTENGKMIYTVNDIEIGSLFSVEKKLLDTYDIEHPAFAAEFSISKIEELKSDLPEPTYEPVSKFPTFEFDLAVVVDSEIKAGDLMDAIHETAGELLDDLQVFDVFEGKSIGKNKKSIAFRLTFLDKNKTLTIKDIEPIINKIVKDLGKTFSAKLRS